MPKLDKVDISLICACVLWSVMLLAVYNAVYEPYPVLKKQDRMVMSKEC